MFIRFDRIHVRDGQTDTARRYMPRLCIASRGKKFRSNFITWVHLFKVTPAQIHTRLGCNRLLRILRILLRIGRLCGVRCLRLPWWVLAHITAISVRVRRRRRHDSALAEIIQSCVHKQNVQLHTEFFLRGPRQGTALRVTPVPSVCLSVP